MVKKVFNSICYRIWNFKRNIKNKRLRELFSNNKIPTIFSCNCTGGVMYNELGWKFNSPTINLYMNCEDFIKFCENYKYYCSLNLLPYEGEIVRDYPICTLGDLTLFMVHYNSFEESKEKWNQRCKRIDDKNIRIIATDRDGCTEILKDRFEKLPFKKIMFTHLPDEEHTDCFYIKGFENDTQVGTVVDPSDRIGGKRYYDQFDWVKFLIE